MHPAAFCCRKGHFVQPRHGHGLQKCASHGFLSPLQMIVCEPRNVAIQLWQCIVSLDYFYTTSLII